MVIGVEVNRVYANDTSLLRESKDVNHKFGRFNNLERKLGGGSGYISLFLDHAEKVFLAARLDRVLFVHAVNGLLLETYLGSSLLRGQM